MAQEKKGKRKGRRRLDDFSSSGGKKKRDGLGGTTDLSASIHPLRLAEGKKKKKRGRGRDGMSHQWS